MAQYEIHLDSSKAKSYNANPIWIRQDDAQDTIKVFCGNDLKVSENSKFEFDTTKFDKNIIKDITSVQSGSFQATDSTNVKDSTQSNEQLNKESKATGGFGWGVTVTIFVLFVLVVGFLYLKYK